MKFGRFDSLSNGLSHNHVVNNFPVIQVIVFGCKCTSELHGILSIDHDVLQYTSNWQNKRRTHQTNHSEKYMYISEDFRLKSQKPR